MKRIFILLLLGAAQASVAQVKKSETVPNLDFKTLLNSPVKSTSLSQLKGKVVLLEFWATWCGSCLIAMPHLNKLQTKYPKSLQIIAVTDETEKRAALYIKSKPANFWFAIDTGRAIAKVFPHQLIPHSILIGPNGKLIAATSPESITEKVIDSLLKKQQVHLPEKKDNLVSHEDLIKQNFFASDTVQYRFMMQAEIKGDPGLSTTWLDNKAFSGRRLTCINLPLTTLYMLANGHYPYSRTIDETEVGKKAPVYCLDLIVQNPADLLPALQKELAKRFDLQAKIKPVIKDVQILRITDTTKFRSIKKNTSGERTYYARHGEIDQQMITMKEFAQYVENYGIEKLVVDETGNAEKFDIKFSFQPENPQSLLNILAGMGLGLTKEQREVNMLILFKQPVIY
ncbi:redoxin family protein [Mucilaginibacter paludis]|uniref:Redoxin domain protein n=1 Tax=Mucilaginibacter paludis DSM 18603 TaxID=714943 RepID=H1YBK0_9SPHI|nr:redoxin family protein [Mucilaginibacter paludis]EHQ25071.1 Redoxin domain protein [Mucilaginibacter paludis DSM 18603]